MDNVSDWSAAGAAAVVVGGAPTSAAKSGGTQSVTGTAQKVLEKIATARKK